MLLLVPCLLPSAVPSSEFRVRTELVPRISFAEEAVPPAELMAFTRPALTERTHDLIEETAGQLRKAVGFDPGNAYAKIVTTLETLAQEVLSGSKTATAKAAVAFMRWGT